MRPGPLEVSRLFMISTASLSLLDTLVSVTILVDIFNTVKSQ